MKNKSDYQELDFNSLIAYEVGTAMGFIGHALYFLDNLPSHLRKFRR